MATDIKPVKADIQDSGWAVSPRYAWYIVIVLMACYTLSFVDRTILALLVTPIRNDLQISDTEMGLLAGLAFALFYTFMGLPMARWADHHNRRNLISAGIAIWSFFTAVCAGARSFGSLALARVGVGVGEAALSPAAYSIMADTFPKQHLATAISVYYMGAFLGASLANFVGGLTIQAVASTPTTVVPILGEIASWRLTFLIVGLPGLFFALLVFTIREPVRRNLLQKANAAQKLSLGETFSEAGKRWKSVLGISLGLIFHGTCTYGFLQWAPSFFERVHGWGPAQRGQAVGTILLIGCLGMYAGGWLSDRWMRRGIVTAPLRVVIPCAIAVMILFPIAFTQGNPWVTLALSAIGLFFLAWPMGTSFAAVQFIFPNQVRGQVSALVLFVLNLGGNTLGPFVPGYLNDAVFHDPNAVGTSLAINMGFAALLMLLIFWLTLKPYERDYRAMHPGA